MIDQLYETAFARSPTEEERSLGKEFLRQATSKRPGADADALAGLCHVLFNVKEFLYVN